MLLFLLEIAMFVAFAIVLVTQLIVPAIKETAFFPYFRKERKLKSEIVNVEQTLEEQRLASEINNKKIKIRSY